MQRKNLMWLFAGVGANLLLRKGWLLQAGAMFDTSALSDSDRTTSIGMFAVPSAYATS